MAEQYSNENSFALFKNEKSQDNQPDYTGTITLEDNKEMRLAAWIRESKSGLKYLSGVMSEPQAKASGSVSNAAVEGSDVPF